MGIHTPSSAQMSPQARWLLSNRFSFVYTLVLAIFLCFNRSTIIFVKIYCTWKDKELKKEFKKRGGRITGKKADLIESPRHIRKNREAAMASVLKDGSNNARILKKLTLESTSAVSEALSTVLISTGADRCNVVTTDHTAVATASDLSPPTISTTETLSTVLTSAQLTPTVAATAVEVSTVNTAVTTSINISPPTINTSSSTSSHFDCYNKRFSVYRGGIDTTMVHDEPLVAELTCRSTMPHRKGINGIRHLSNHLPRIRDFGTQTDIKITDDDIMFLKNLKAKRMEISHINAIVKNNEYIVSYHEPEESYRWDYLRMLNGEGPYNGLAEWERNQMHLEAIATVMNMQNINANINVPNGADIKKHPPGNISPISDDSQ